MSGNAQALLQSFEALSETEQREFASIILSRADLWDDGPLSDDDLTRIADERFGELDLEEGRHGQDA